MTRSEDHARIARLGIVPPVHRAVSIRAAGKAMQTAPGIWRVEVSPLQQEVLAASLRNLNAIRNALPASDIASVMAAMMGLRERSTKRVFMIHGQMEMDVMIAAVETSRWLDTVAHLGTTAVSRHRISLRELAEKLRHVTGRNVAAGMSNTV